MTFSEQAFTKPARRTFFVADLKCYMCGSVSGSVESEQSLAGSGSVAHPVLFRRNAGAQPIQIIKWQRLRCDRCSGPLFLDETDIVTRRYDDYNWLEERPRRGRPPKRLIEERRRERELLESQQAA